MIVRIVLPVESDPATTFEKVHARGALKNQSFRWLISAFVKGFIPVRNSRFGPLNVHEVGQHIGFHISLIRGFLLLMRVPSLGQELIDYFQNGQSCGFFERSDKCILIPQSVQPGDLCHLHIQAC